MATIEDFQKLDIRTGKIIDLQDFPEAKKPAYKLKIDFGPEIGIKNSSVQIVALYTKEELMGKLVLGVVNFPPRKIGPFESEVLTRMGRTNERENRSKISVIAESKEEADNIFNGLSVGGEIEMPIGDSPWGTYFAMFRDKYGIEWMIEFDPK